jgi:FAD/FMN-containing dehydrogenase/Fe-S oxidoreductase
MALNPDLIAELRKRFRGDIRQDLASKILYSTDASIYQIEPAGVLIPRTSEDLQVAVDLAAKHGVSVTARGAGTSLAGQAIGPGLILDCSRWLDRILEINAEQQTAIVEPGVILADLNRATAPLGLQFGPDPASAERATMGGIVANNATGAHSIQHGMTVDHLLAANVVLSDGSMAAFGPIRVSDSGTPSVLDTSRQDRITASVIQIREEYAQTIRDRFPRTWRNSAGYRINYLLPWAPGAPPGWRGSDYPEQPAHADFNLAQLLAGSEGTLGIIRDVTVRLVPRPRHTVLGILAFHDLPAACEAVLPLLEQRPSAIELVPRLILQAARRIPDYAGRMRWLQGDPAAVLVVEFAGDEPSALLKQAKAMSPEVQVADAPDEQAMVWATRKAGLGLLDSTPGPARPTSFIEDCAIPVEHLAAFVRELEAIMDAHAARGGIYGHASAGCLHVRPVLDLKTGGGVRALRRIAEETLALTMRLGGVMSSEHGDGMTRGEWLRKTYGQELAEAMLSLKHAADPDGILNPGKMLDAPPMDTHLRYGTSYQVRGWAPAVELSRRGGLAAAIEQCNGQGVCRKDTGVMCPSFQATREEMYSTRGRANLLRALISTGLPATSNSRKSRDVDAAVFRALDLCLACKGCLAECPSGVDMAQLKSEYLHHHYHRRLRPLRDYMFGYFGRTVSMLAILAPVFRLVQDIPGIWRVACGLLGLAPERRLPDFVRGARRPIAAGAPSALVFQDPYSHNVDVEVEAAAYALLQAAGYEARPLKTIRSCAAPISRGFLDAARREAQAILAELQQIDPLGQLPLVVVEPSELEALRHDMHTLLPNLAEADANRFARACSVEELLVESGRISSLQRGTASGRVLFHPHCHERAGKREPPGGDPFAGMSLLKQCGYEVELVDAGCCGMGGTFGFEAEHYELSQQIGALKLFPAIEASTGAMVAATGGACRMHITQGTRRTAEHPLVLAARALRLS